MKGTNKLKNTRKLIDVSTLMQVFVSHKRINVCEHTVKMAPRDCSE